MFYCNLLYDDITDIATLIATTNIRKTFVSKESTNGCQYTEQLKGKCVQGLPFNSIKQLKSIYVVAVIILYPFPEMKSIFTPNILSW